MNKDATIKQLTVKYNLGDVFDKVIGDAYDEGGKEGTAVAVAECEVDYNELRESLHVFLQESCFCCGYAPLTLKREIETSGQIHTELYHCTRCHMSGKPMITAIIIQYDGVEL